MERLKLGLWFPSIALFLQMWCFSNAVSAQIFPEINTTPQPMGPPAGWWDHLKNGPHEFICLDTLHLRLKDNSFEELKPKARRLNVEFLFGSEGWDAVIVEISPVPGRNGKLLLDAEEFLIFYEPADVEVVGKFASSKDPYLLKLGVSRTWAAFRLSVEDGDERYFVATSCEYLN